METLLIVLVIVVVVGVVALLAITPKVRARQSAASLFVKEQLGGEDRVERLERLANAFGSEPAGDDELRGPGALGLGADRLVFALTPDQSVTIDRADIVDAQTTAQPGDTGKAMLKVVHRRDGAEVTSSWRLPEAAEWAEALRG